MSTERRLTHAAFPADRSIHPRYEAALKQVTQEFGKHHPMHIDGRAVMSTEAEFEDKSPVDTGIVLGFFQKGTAVDLKKALVSAKSGFDFWSNRDWSDRVGVVRKAANLMEERMFQLAALVTYEVGKNRYEAIGEVDFAFNMLRYYADLMEKNAGFETTLAGGPGERSKSVLKPYGVWVVLSPFNFPLALASGMVAGALITGNTVVLKPSSEAPFTSLNLYEILIEAGVPGGAINYLTGPGESFGEEIAKNQNIAGVAFTGSKEVGMKLYRDFVLNQPYPKPFILEMSGKNPTIVTSKADLEKSAEGIIRSAYGYGGQKCSATSRVYVERRVKNDFLKILKSKVDRIVVGDPRSEDTFVGPVIGGKALKKFEKSIELARKNGGKILSGGGLVRGKNIPNGYYVEPSVVTGLPEDSSLVKEELFVPLIIVEEFKNMDEALGKANDSEFGLTAGIFTEDPNEVQTFFRKIESGVTYANRKGGSTSGAWPGAQPYVGWKGSGATGKGAGGQYYLLSFMREQAQTIMEDPPKH